MINLRFWKCSLLVCLLGVSSVACGGSSNPSAPTSTPVVSVPAASYTNIVGSWNGTLTSSGLGISVVCNFALLVNSQSGGQYAGSYQISGAPGCSSAGNVDGSISQVPGSTISMSN